MMWPYLDPTPQPESQLPFSCFVEIENYNTYKTSSGLTFQVSFSVQTKLENGKYNLSRPVFSSQDIKLKGSPYSRIMTN